MNEQKDKAKALADALAWLDKQRSTPSVEQIKRHIDMSLFEDGSSAYTLLQANTNLIRYCSKELLCDEAFVECCVSEHPHMVLYVHESLKKSEKVFKKTLIGNPNYIEYFDDHLRDNVNLCTPFVLGVCGQNVYRSCGPTVRSDVVLSRKVTRQWGQSYVHCTGAAREDRLTALQAVMLFEAMAGYVPNALYQELDKVSRSYEGNLGKAAHWLLQEYASECQAQYLSEQLSVHTQANAVKKSKRGL